MTTRRLTPALVRVVLGGEGLDDFTPCPDADAYVNAFFVPDDAPYAVPFDDTEVRDLPPEQRPRPRRYTVRHWDPESRLLSIDFVVHGDVGWAGRWATRAAAGDRLQLRGPAGSYTPHPDADSYLLVGDESALPAIAACAEAVPAGRPVVAVVEVDAADGELDLGSTGDLSVHWVHRSGHDGDPDTLLADAVRSLTRPVGLISAFVHGEAASVRAVQRHLLGDGVVDQAHLSASPYWRRGHTDEEWRTVKAAWQRDVESEMAALIG